MSSDYGLQEAYSLSKLIFISIFLIEQCKVSCPFAELSKQIKNKKVHYPDFL